jgi:outer membrane protein TolC
MMKYFKIVFLFILMQQPLRAQQIITLNDAILLALDLNYGIQIAKNNYEVTKLNNTTGNAGMLPQLSASINQDNQTINTKQRFLNGAENIRNNAINNTLNGNVELSWTVFNGTRMFITKQKLAAAEMGGKLALRREIEQTIVQVTKAYYNLVLQLNKVKLLEHNLSLSKQRAKFIEDKFTNGKAARSELIRATIDVNTDESLLMRETLLYNAAKENLKALIGPINFTDYNVIENIVFDSLDVSLLGSSSINNYTPLLQLKNNKQLARHSLNEFKADRSPVFQLRTGYLFSTINSEAGFLQTASNSGFHYGAGVQFNLFNGFDINRKIAAAKLVQKNVDFALADSTAKATIALNNLIKQYEFNKRLVVKETHNAMLANEAYNITNEQYKAGKITILELRSVQTEWLQAENRLLQAKQELAITETEIKLITGKLVN